MSYMEQQMQQQIEAGISQAEHCYNRIGELEAQNAELLKLVNQARDVYIAENADGETDCVTPYDHYKPVAVNSVESTFIKLLPKEPLYLDPPDGGSVSVEEQLRRYIADILNQRDQAVANVKEEAYQAYWKASDDNRSDRWADEFDDDVRTSFEIWWGSK